MADMRGAELAFRRPAPDELVEFLAVSVRSYGSDDAPEKIAHELLSNEIDRSFGAWDNGRCVAGSGAFSLEVTMPGGQVLPAAGVTMIGVEPTHRRRGILTAMLRHLHADAADRVEPIALLTASETSIYRRFGYGMVADVAHLSIAADNVRFDPPLADPGSVELIDPRVDTTELERVFDRLRRLQPGWLSLTPGMWAQFREDPEWNRDGRTPLRAVVHRDAAGNVDGYATWRIAGHHDPDRLAGNTLCIEMLGGLTPDVEAALWAFFASIDLVTTVEWENGPADPTIRWRLVEPRQLRTLARADMVWARLLDIPAVLSARTYGAPGSFLLEVTDRFHPERGGRFRLSCPARDEQGGCIRVEPGRADETSVALPGEPDDAGVLAVDTADLASLAFGAVSASTLADAGRLCGSVKSIDLADALFALPRPPWWPIEF